MFDETLFRAQMVIAGITFSDIAKALGINESTVFRKLADNGRFTRNEIAILYRVLKIQTADDLNRIFFATKTSDKKEGE